MSMISRRPSAHEARLASPRSVVERKPLQDRSKKTRELLLAAAYRVFVRDGFESAQIDTIAREAGRTKGAVYAHFENKEHLFLSLLEQRIRAVAEQMDAVVAAEDDPARSIDLFRAALTDLGDPEWAILNLELKLYAMRHPQAAERIRIAFRRIHDGEAAGIVSKRLSDGRPATGRLSALWGIMSAIVLDMNFDPDLLSRKEARLILGEVFDGLFHRGERVSEQVTSKHSSLANRPKRPKSK